MLIHRRFYADLVPQSFIAHSYISYTLSLEANSGRQPISANCSYLYSPDTYITITSESIQPQEYISALKPPSSNLHYWCTFLELSPQKTFKISTPSGEMPGRRYPGPRPNAPHGTYPFLQDELTPPGSEDSTHDLDRNSVYMPTVEPLPFIPTKHKACRKPNYYAAWLKGKPGIASDLLTGKTGPISTSVPSNGGNDSDNLGEMVDDFIESGCESNVDASDSDGGPPSITKLCDTLQQALTSPYGGIEGELFHEVRRLILAIDVDTDLVCYSKGSDCQGGCIKRLVVKQLRAAGHDAGVCKSKLLKYCGLLAGALKYMEYEYIDVEVHSKQTVERLIVDVDFHDQFCIARATPNYEAALKLLPTIFVGTTKRLEKILQIMSEAAKVSIKQSDLVLPPWRRLDYMISKWLSYQERAIGNNPMPSLPTGSCLGRKGRLSSTPETRHCDVKIKRMKESLLSEVKSSPATNILGRGRTRQFLSPRSKRCIG